MLLPEIEFSMNIPNGYYTLQRGQQNPTDVSDDIRNSLNSLQKIMTEYDYAVGLKDDGSVSFKIACDLSQTKKDYTDMTESEFDQIIEKLQTGVAHDQTIDSVKKVQTKNLVFAERIYHSADEFYIEYYTVKGGNEYYLIYFGEGSKPTRLITEEISDMIYSVAISPVPLSHTAASPSPGSSASYLVEIGDPPLSFTLPGSFTGIKSTDDLQQLQGQWRELFELIQPKMADADVYFYAVKTDDSGRVKQMAVTTRNTDKNTLQQLFDAGKAKIDELLDCSGGTGKNTMQYALNDKLFVNDVVFAKHYISADDYSWLLYQPTRNDVPFAFAYASDGFVVTASDEADMNKLIENFKGKTTAGTDIPGNMSATDIAMQQFNTTVLLIALSAVAASWAVALLLYRKNRKIAQNENVDLWIDRLDRLRIQGNLSDKEFERKKQELLKR